VENGKHQDSLNSEKKMALTRMSRYKTTRIAEGPDEETIEGHRANGRSGKKRETMRRRI